MRTYSTLHFSIPCAIDVAKTYESSVSVPYYNLSLSRLLVETVQQETLLVVSTMSFRTYLYKLDRI
jgi:hypothetical protein